MSCPVCRLRDTACPGSPCAVCAAAGPSSYKGVAVTINEGAGQCPHCRLTRETTGRNAGSPCPRCGGPAASGTAASAWVRCVVCRVRRGDTTVAGRSSTTATGQTVAVCVPCFEHLVQGRGYCAGCRAFGVAEPDEVLCAAHLGRQQSRVALAPAPAAAAARCRHCGTNAASSGFAWCDACLG